MIFKDSYYKPIEKDLNYYFYELFWKDILHLLKGSNIKLNAVSPLLSAIREGRIKYENGTFTGKFNMKISAELEKFAKYDGRKKSWKGIPPSSVSAVAVIANDKARTLNQEITRLISEIPARVNAAIDSLKYSIDQPLFAMNKAASSEIASLGLSPEVTPELSRRISEEYTNNMNVNIQNWSPERTARLRELVEKNALMGYNRRELEKMISSEYDVDLNKARFLARQETSLLMASIRNERYIDAGLELYKWSNSGDIRVVGKPGGLYPEPSPGHGNHWELGGKICKLSDPTIYADTIEDAKNNKWKSKSMIGGDMDHPGQAFNCRCTSIPII